MAGFLRSDHSIAPGELQTAAIIATTFAWTKTFAPSWHCIYLYGMHRHRVGTNAINQEHFTAETTGSVMALEFRDTLNRGIKVENKGEAIFARPITILAVPSSFQS